MDNKTFYVYDPTTKEVLYTIINPTQHQCNALQKKGVFGHFDIPGISILNKIVTTNAITNQTESIVDIKEIEDYIVMSDNKLVANGTHRVIISNLKLGSIVTLYDTSGGIFPITISEDNKFLIFDSSSIRQPENVIKFNIFEFGCTPKDYYIPIEY